MRPWHAIRTTARREFTVALSLSLSLNLEAYCPSYVLSYRSRFSRTGSPVREVVIPYLAGYVFARWDAADPYLWHSVHALSGVVEVLGDPFPAPVPEKDILELRKMIGDDGRLVEIDGDPSSISTTLSPNDPVRVLDGPWAGYTAIVDTLDRRGLVANVKISGLLRRDALISCPVIWLEPIALEPKDSYATPAGWARRDRKRGRRGSRTPRESPGATA